VGNRATALRLHDGRILLLNPVPLEPLIQANLTALGGVHFLACDLGHHLYVKSYLDVWPDAKTIGVPGLEKKRKDVRWDFVCGDWSRGGPEDEFAFSEDIETVFFEGFITYCVAWYHKPTKTLIQSDLLMNLPCTEVNSVSKACEPKELTTTSNIHLHHPNKVGFLVSSLNVRIRGRSGQSA
jgi:hypothetical protein